MAHPLVTAKRYCLMEYYFGLEDCTDNTIASLMFDYGNLYHSMFHSNKHSEHALLRRHIHIPTHMHTRTHARGGIERGWNAGLRSDLVEICLAAQ